MSRRRHAENLKQIDAALKLFPKVLADQRRAFAEREKIQKRFATMSRALARKVDADRAQTVKVREHLRTAPRSQTHPDGTTVVHEHNRRIGSSRVSDLDDINRIFSAYDRDVIPKPTKGRLKFKNSDAFR